MTGAESTAEVLSPPERKETWIGFRKFSMGCNLPPIDFDRQNRTQRLPLPAETRPQIQEGTCPDREFKYLSLPKGYIRLAIIHPGESRLVCSLAIASLKALPQYEALSYVWGSSERPWDIECRYIGQISRDFNPNGSNGPSLKQLGAALPESGKVPITNNLGFSLKGIRHASKYRVVWVDSLCIHQENLDERSQQVRLMYQIYEQAEKVVIWLGRSTPSTPKAFQCIREINKLQVKRQRRKKERCHVVHSYNIGFHFPMSQWLDLAELLNNSWFRRVWVFQENVASTKSIIQQGDWFVDWDVFSQACGMVQEFLAGNRTMIETNPGSCWVGNKVVDMPFIEKGGRKEQNSKKSVSPSLQKLPKGGHWDVGVYTSKMPRIALETALSMDSVRRSLKAVDRQSACSDDIVKAIDKLSPRKDTNRLGLVQLLPMLRPAESTDPLDKVFALMNIADQKSDNSNQGFSIDYKILPRDLYISTMVYWLSSGQYPNLGFLNHIQPERSNYNLPSFVPDWSLSLKSRPLSELGRGFKASGDSRSVINLKCEAVDGSTSATLTVRGVRLLQIQHWTPMTDTDMRGILDRFEVMATLLRTLGSNITHEQTHAPSSIFLTLLRRIGSNNIKNAYGTTLESFCLALKSTLLLMAPDPKPSGTDPIKFWKPVSVGTGQPKINHRITEMDRWEQVVGDVCLKEIRNACGDMLFTKSFFSTAEGYIGLGPYTDFREGYEICILFGCSTPFIIRKEKNGYALVGECYVAGLMAGEAMEGLDLEKIEDFEFK
ncbi:heterokaryon incompatibility protein-domain-containing protein [Halenospora varia]|nr:heterokaryon incompatibility protein-domain-containing protein [Halenospora varia]